jgi:flagellar secretion chaperone FliS
MNDMHNTYLEQQVFTATPQKLRLMLIEGAVRFSQRAIEAHAQQNREDFQNKMIRTRDIVCELLTSIQNVKNDITNQARALYAFLLRECTEIQLTEAGERLTGVIKVLEEERITWSKLCEMHPKTLHEQHAHQQPAQISFIVDDVDLPQTESSFLVDA